jgi:hypothetical protein
MGANDPIRTTTEPMSDALVAAVTGAIGMTLADRAAGGVLANPVLQAGFISKANFEKALGAQIVRIAYGADKYITTAEGNDFTILDLASDKATVTPARMGFARQMSDMARSLDSWGILDYARFAADGTVGWQQTMLSTIAALATSLSATGGDTGNDATWGAVLADFMALGAANVAGPYVLLCRPKDWGNIAQDAYALGGRVAQSSETDAYLKAANPGFKGIFMGGDLWIYTTSELPTSGGDTVSMMFGSGCVAWDAHMPAPSRSTNPLLWTPLFGVETDRIPLKSEDYIAYSTHIGASLDINAAGIKMPFVT